MICCNPFGVSTPHPWDKQTASQVRGSGQLPEAWRSWEEVTFPPRVRAPLVSAGFKADSLGGLVPCFARKTHPFLEAYEVV